MQIIVIINLTIDIHRLKVCQWAYGWTRDELIFEIKKMITEKQWDYFFEQKKRTEEIKQSLMLELQSKNYIQTFYLLKEDKTKSYGNKYIKRKHRF